MLETLQLHLATSATSYRPGDAVIALLQASSGAASVELQEVELQFVGVERVDTSWVSPAYRRDVPPINADKRHLQRHVVFSRLQAATQGTLGGARDRKFVVRFTLPTTLLPSFRGTAVRVSYHLSAAVHYRLVQPASAAAQLSDSPEASVASFAPSEAATEQQLQDTVTPEGITTSTVQLPIHIWPLKAESEGSPLPSPGGQGAEPLPLVGSEEMPIKCWEIGPGTGVQEAITHICRLIAQQQPAASGAGPAQPDTAGAASQGGDQAEPGGSGSSTDEAGEELAAGAGPTARQHSMPLGRTATTESERGLLLSPMDPSAVLRSYALRIGEHAIARVSLHPPVEGALHPGATLAGTVELLHPESTEREGEGAEPRSAAADGVPRCMQVLILLETEERLAAQWRPASKAVAGAGVIRRVYEEQLEITADMAATHFVFTLPPGSQANFTTPLLQLQWVLRFQFTASTPRPGGGGGSNPLQGKIDQLSWALPLFVGAPQ